VISTDIFTIPAFPNRNIIYLPLRGMAFFADDTSSKIIQDINTGLLNSEQVANSLVFRQLKELGVLNTAFDSFPVIENIQEFKPTKAIILLTESCNLECVYCYANATPRSGNKIPLKIIKSAINTIVQNALVSKKHHASITFLGGGEPTLEWKTLVLSTEYARELCDEKGVSLGVSLVTNGSLLSKERVDWISKNLDSISLSFEILPDIQLLQRPYHGRKNSYHRIAETIQWMNDVGVDFSTRTTITNNNVKRMTEMVKYGHDIFSVKEMLFEPLSDSNRSLTMQTIFSQDDFFVEEFMNARKAGRALGINVECSISKNIDKIKPRFCNVEFCITAEGLVTACHRFSRKETTHTEEFVFGQYENNNFAFDIDKINKITSSPLLSQEACQNCFAKWHCGGDCLAVKTNQSGSRCNLIRGVLKEIILERMLSQENVL